MRPERTRLTSRAGVMFSIRTWVTAGTVHVLAVGSPARGRTGAGVCQLSHVRK